MRLSTEAKCPSGVTWLTNVGIRETNWSVLSGTGGHAGRAVCPQEARHSVFQQDQLVPGKKRQQSSPELEAEHLTRISEWYSHKATVTRFLIKTLLCYSVIEDSCSCFLPHVL